MTVTAKNISEMAYLVCPNIQKWTARGVSEKKVIKDGAFDKKHVKAIQDLIGDKSKLTELSSIHGQAKSLLKRNSIPYIGEGVYLIPEIKLEQVIEELKVLQKRFSKVAEDFLTSHKELKVQFQKDNPGIANTARYPGDTEMRSKFYFTWTVRQYNAPAGLPASIQKEEMQKFVEEVKQIKEDTKNMIANEVIKRINVLTGQFEDGKVNSNTINGINKFIDKVEDLFQDFFTQKKLTETLQDVRKYLSDLDADDIRKSEELKTDLQKGLSEAVKTIEKLPDIKLSDSRKSRAIDF